MSEKQSSPSAPATERNREAILEVLQRELADAGAVLEIGSGTGQHAVFFGQNMPDLQWQTSDRTDNHAGIVAWVGTAGLENVAQPIELDVEKVDAVSGNYDAVFSANTAHIMSFAAVVCMFRLVGGLLSNGGAFCLYGPFNVNGEFTSASNDAFDQSLKSRDPLMGIRDLEALIKLGMQNGLEIASQYAMPANNMLLVWHKV